jgi:hypothetical protein
LTSQVRMYRVKKGELDAFVDEWRGGVVPLRKKFGFTIGGAWLSRTDDRFVWILSYRGPGTFEARDALYYDSPERKSLRPDPAARVEKIEHWLMEPVAL